MSFRILQQRRKAQRGIAMVWMLVAMIVIMAFSAFSLDTAYWHYTQAQLKRGADAAALAAAYEMQLTANSATANSAALQYAAWNNIQLAVGTDGNVISFPTVHSRWVRVTATVPRSRIFSGFFGIGVSNINQTSTAQWYMNTEMPPSAGTYGIPANQAFNYSVFGPLSNHQWGDEYSTKYLENGTLNPNYDGKGYNFDLQIGSNYQTKFGNKFQVELYDASCYTANNTTNYDEMHTENTAIKGYSDPNSVTQTWYTVQYQDSSGNWQTATNSSGTIARATYTGESYAHDAWVDNPNLLIDLSAYPSGTSFRLNVTSTDPSLANPVGSNTGLHGSSENGYSLRVSPPLPSKDYSDTTNHVLNSKSNTNGITDTTWASTYASDSNTTIVASGDSRIQVNFNQTATVTITLAQLPSLPYGGTVTVTRFDTDVLPSTGGTLVYSYPGGTQNFTTQLNSQPQNDKQYDDTWSLPTGFQGGLLTASYTATTGDTSDWMVTASGPGIIGLVGESGQTY